MDEDSEIPQSTLENFMNPQWSCENIPIDPLEVLPRSLGSSSNSVTSGKKKSVMTLIHQGLSSRNQSQDENSGLAKNSDNGFKELLDEEKSMIRSYKNKLDKRQTLSEFSNEKNRMKQEKKDRTNCSKKNKNISNLSSSADCAWDELQAEELAKIQLVKDKISSRSKS